MVTAKANITGPLRRGAICSVIARCESAEATTTKLPALLPLNRAPADVAPAKSFRPVDQVDRAIRTFARITYGLAHRANVQHAAAIGDDVTAAAPGAGVKDLDVLDCPGLVETLDDRALAVVAGITLRRHDHGDRGVVIPAQIEMAELTVGASEQRRHDVGFHPHHQHLGFWIAEAGVVLDEFWPVLRHHDADKEHALVRRPHRR